VGVAELVGQAGVVVAVAGVQVAAEAAGDLVDGPVAELMTAEGSRGLQMRQQLHPAVGDVAVGVWWLGVGGVQGWRAAQTGAASASPTTTSWGRAATGW
jgi:hypothetical protein